MSERKWSLKRLLRFNLRTILLLMLVLGAWLAWHIDRTKKQKRAVQAIADAGGWVRYDYQFAGGVPDYSRGGTFLPNAESPFPEFLLHALGHDFFHSVVELNLVYKGSGPKRLDNDNVTSTDWAMHVHGLPNLRSALVKEYQANDAALGELGKLKKLKFYYHWDGRSITDEGVKHLVKARTLEEIHLGFSKITDESLRHFASLPNVKELTLQGSQLSDQGLFYLRETSSLSELWVGRGDSNITDEGLKHLHDLVNLTALGIQQVNASQKAVDELAEKLGPGCKVSYSKKPAFNWFGRGARK